MLGGREPQMISIKKQLKDASIENKLYMTNILHHPNISMWNKDHDIPGNKIPEIYMNQVNSPGSFN